MWSIHNGRPEDRRREPRFECGSSAWLIAPVSLPGQIKDLSFTGMLLEVTLEPGQALLDVGVEVMLRFQLLEKTPTLKVRGTVVRHDGARGLGIDFAGLMPRDRETMTAYLRAKEDT